MSWVLSMHSDTYNSFKNIYSVQKNKTILVSQTGFLSAGANSAPTNNCFLNLMPVLHKKYSTNINLSNCLSEATRSEVEF